VDIFERRREGGRFEKAVRVGMCCWRGWRVALVGLWGKCDAWARTLRVYGFRFECVKFVQFFEIEMRSQ
jgi:hypothetical protein